MPPTVMPAVLCLGGLALSVAWVRRRVGPLRRTTREALGERAYASILDFVIGIELILVFTGLILQYGLMTHALLVVNHAAYWAARSASVYIPAFYPEAAVTAEPSHPAVFGLLRTLLAPLQLVSPELPEAGDAATGEEPNTFGALKRERVKMAAALACLPAATDLTALASKLTGLGLSLDSSSLGLAGTMAGKLLYAWKFTEVQVFGWNAQFEAADPASAWTFLASVQFRYHLKVPFARRLMSWRDSGPWGWRGSKLEQLARQAGVGSSAPAKDYVPLLDTPEQYVLLSATWPFFRENGYWSTEATEADPNKDPQNNPDYAEYIRQRDANQGNQNAPTPHSDGTVTYESGTNPPEFPKGNPEDDPNYQQGLDDFAGKTPEEVQAEVDRKIAEQRRQNREAYRAGHNGQEPPYWDGDAYKYYSPQEIAQLKEAARLQYQQTHDGALPLPPDPRYYD